MGEPGERNLHLLASTASFLENHFASPRGPLLIDTGDNNGYNAAPTAYKTTCLSPLRMTAIEGRRHCPCANKSGCSRNWLSTAEQATKPQWVWGARGCLIGGFAATAGGH